MLVSEQPHAPAAVGGKKPVTTEQETEREEARARAGEDVSENKNSREFNRESFSP
jgi:hypothetical protein